MVSGTSFRRVGDAKSLSQFAVASIRPKARVSRAGSPARGPRGGDRRLPQTERLRDGWQYLRANVINHILMILSVGLFSNSELIPQELAPPYEEVADALAGMVQRALAPGQPGDSEQGKRAFRVYLEQLASPGGGRTLHS